ncbi:MAG: hypothetical protein EOO99_02905 [Pedobacter sp.]|nr:MAG: hypothetical protein EOO99_02905 [Pedobacter sp.]
MKKDIPVNLVQNVAIAIVLIDEGPDYKNWNVYLLNMRNEEINTVIVNAKGYGEYQGKEVKTSLLRHFIGDIPSNSFKALEAIDPQVFGLTNEYWVSYYIGPEIYDKKFIFLPESIVEDNLIKIPLINKMGIMIN